jgi:uncharacterized LabA/DUF88 family protein
MPVTTALHARPTRLLRAEEAALHNKMSKRIALFIDGAHLHRTTKTLGFDVDYTRLLQEFGKYGSIVRAYFYTIEKDDDAGSSIHPLLDWLDYNGFTMRRKRIREYDDGNGRRRKARHSE